MSLTNPILPGTINPVKRVIKKKQLHFDSSFRANYGAPGSSASSFLYNLPVEVEDIISIRLTNIYVPNCIYLISKARGNNTITIDGNTIVIPDGTYDIESMHDIINATISVSGLTNIQFTNNAIETQKTEINNTSGSDVVIDFFKDNTCNNFMNTLGWILGFRVKTLTIPNNKQAISTGLFDNGLGDYLFLSIDDFQRNTSTNNIVYMNNTTVNKNILAKIYRYGIDGSYNLNQLYDGFINSDKVRTYYGPVRLSKIKIALLDKFGNKVDMNNMDFSFTLEAEILYDSDIVTIPC